MPRDRDLWTPTPALGSRALVHNFRIGREWTQAQAADWYGCTPRTWRKYEAGALPVPAPLLKRIASSSPYTRRTA